jgi:paraquat-inducible protein A
MSVVVLCPACDLAHRRSASLAREPMQCARCRALLQRPENAAIDTAIALALSATVLLVLANAYPLVIMHVNGSSRETTLIGAAAGLYAQGFGSLALLVGTTIIAIPLLEISALLYVLIPLRLGRRAFAQRTFLRVLARVRPWSFMEVFMLGALVASVRLSNFAEVTTGISLWCCLLLMLSLSALTNMTSPQQLWGWVERSGP